MDHLLPVNLIAECNKCSRWSTCFFSTNEKPSFSSLVVSMGSLRRIDIFKFLHVIFILQMGLGLQSPLAIPMLERPYFHWDSGVSQSVLPASWGREIPHWEIWDLQFHMVFHRVLVVARAVQVSGLWRHLSAPISLLQDRKCNFCWKELSPWNKIYKAYFCECKA